MFTGWVAVGLGLAAALIPAAAPAQDAYPSRPVRVVVGLAPGGGTDIQARMFAQKLSEIFNRPFVVENRAGAGGTVAYAQVAKSAPDGHTLLGVTSGYTITHIPYKGTGPALVDIMAGQVHMLFGNVLSTLTYVKAGRLRALAVTTATRSTVLPDLPTIAESGLPGYENSTWHGWLAPAGTPPAILNRLNAELVKSARARDLLEKLAADGGEGVGSTSEQFGRHLVAEIARWRKVVKEAGVTLE